MPAGLCSYRKTTGSTQKNMTFPEACESQNLIASQKHGFGVSFSLSSSVTPMSLEAAIYEV